MKKRFILLLIAMLFNGLTVSAQSWLWGRQGTTGLKYDMYSENVATNKTGNVYHTGTFTYTINFGTDTLNSEGDDVYLVKYDSSGNLLWATQSITMCQDMSLTTGCSVATDDSDNAYISGILVGDSAWFGTKVIYNNNYPFLAKYDSNGNIKWVVQPNLLGCMANAVATDKKGYEYVTGAGGFLLKYDRNGNLIWSYFPKNGNAGAITYGSSVAIDSNENIFIAGEFQGVLTYNSYKLTSIPSSVFIVKFDSSGNVLWAHQPVNSSIDGMLNYSVTTDASGAAYLTGGFNDTISFGAYTFRASDKTDLFNFNFFLVKYNPGGSIEWAKAGVPLSGTSCIAASICTDDSNHLYLSGGAGEIPRGVFVFSNDTISAYNTGADYGAFLFKLDTMGNIICQSTLTAGGELANSVASNPTGQFVYLGGAFAAPFVFGGDSLNINTGGFDPYVGRWQPCGKCELLAAPAQSLQDCSGQAINLVASGGTSYTWSPSAGLSSSTGNSVTANPAENVTYVVTVSASALCKVVDSIVVTVLSAPNVPTVTISVTGDSLISSAQDNNQWYENDTMVKYGTGQVLVITGRPKGWYEVTVSNPANGCSTTSDSTTSVNQLSVISEQLLVYPNPTSNTVFVKINSAASNVKDWSLQFTDVLGRTLYTKSSLNYSNEIDLPDLPSGVYFIAVVNKTGRAVFPVVKQ